MKQEIQTLITRIQKIKDYMDDESLKDFFQEKTQIKRHDINQKKIAEVIQKLEITKNNLKKLSKEERFYLERNYDIKLLSFYLQDLILRYEDYINNHKQEIASGNITNKDFAEGTQFWHQFGLYMDKLYKEFVEEIRKQVSTTDSKLLRLTTQKAEKRYRKHFAHLYQKDRKGYIDKFFRDYNQTGIPHKIISTMAGFKGTFGWKMDYIICILRGGLPYAVLFEAMGFPKDRVIHISCSRNYTGTGNGRDVILNYTDPNIQHIKGKKILIVENNTFEGKTLIRTMPLIKKYKPKSIQIFLDYMGKQGITKKDLCNELDIQLHKAHVSQNKIAEELDYEEMKMRMIRELEKK